MTNRRHSKLNDLPQELVDEMQRLVLDGEATYQEIADYLGQMGHQVSRSSVGRWGQELLQRRRQLEATVATAKELVAISGEVSLEELATALSLDKIIDVLMRHDEADVGEIGLSLKELTDIMRAVSSVQGASIARERWRSEVADRAKRAADDVARTATQAGLSDEAVQLIRARILGIADHG